LDVARSAGARAACRSVIFGIGRFKIELPEADLKYSIDNIQSFDEAQSAATNTGRIGERRMIQDFFKPQTVAEALELKEKLKDEAVFMAGGTDVNCTNSRYEIEKVIGIEQLELNKISKAQGQLSIGAGVTIQELIDSPKIPDQLKTAAGHFVNRNIRNMATIGGNIASNNSASNLIPILVALDAELRIGGSASPVPVYEYVTREMTGLIEAVMISSTNLAKKYDLRKFSRAANDISIITAAVTFNIQNNKLSDARVAVGGVGQHVMRLTEFENKLENKKLLAPTEIEAAVKNIVAPLTDIRGGSQFKKYMAGVLVSDCIHNAHDGGGPN
jgi:putative selenate reductase FAD-binding subunit